MGSSALVMSSRFPCRMFEMKHEREEEEEEEGEGEEQKAAV